MEEFLNSCNIDHKIVTLSYDNKLDNYYGDVYRGFDFPIYKQYLNPVFSALVYRNVKRYVKKLKESGYIVHYGSNSITPITNYDVVTLHDIGFRESYRDAPTYKQLGQYYGYFFIFKKFLKFNNIIVLTKVLKDILIENYNYSGNVYVVPHFYNPIFRKLDFKELTFNKIQLRKELNLPTNKKLILSISTDKPNKNIAILHDVLNLLDDSFKLVRVGPKIGKSITFTNLNHETNIMQCNNIIICNR